MCMQWISSHQKAINLVLIESTNTNTFDICEGRCVFNGSESSYNLRRLT